MFEHNKRMKDMNFNYSIRSVYVVKIESQNGSNRHTKSIPFCGQVNLSTNVPIMAPNLQKAFVVLYEFLFNEVFL